MKRSLNIKDSIMMPPPKARPKSRSDTSEELRKNLIDTITNTSDCSAIQEEFHKFFKENEELELRKNDEELSLSKSTSSINFEKVTSIGNSQISPYQCNGNGQAERDPKNSFNFNLVNYNYTNLSDEEENLESIVSLEKLRQNLIQEKVSVSPSTGGVSNSNLNTNYANKNLLLPMGNNFKKFVKLPEPKNRKEVKMFVNNMLAYINEHEFDSNMHILKIKIQTRDNDYKNNGLKFDYYKDSLIKMQKEIISRICMYNEEEKKVEIGKD